MINFNMLIPFHALKVSKVKVLVAYNMPYCTQVNKVYQFLGCSVLVLVYIILLNNLKMSRSHTWYIVGPFDVVNIILPRKAASIAFQIYWILAVQVCVTDESNYVVGKIWYLLHASWGPLFFSREDWPLSRLWNIQFMNKTSIDITRNVL